ncbi:MAG: hypothetical protein HQL30_10320, partial [Candidatus Omnitrophica bacterium]|nr:hypothetical protein [Candidatus Omnitrophota bacterium]
MKASTLTFKITSVLLIAAMVSEDISFAIDRYEASSTSTLAPTSIFAPLYAIRWDEVKREYEITEVPGEERGLTDLNKKEVGKSYIEALIGVFLKDLEVREALKLSPAAIDEYFEKFRAALIKLRDSSINPSISKCFRGYGIEAMEYTRHGVELTLSETAGEEKRMRYELAGGEVRVIDLEKAMDEVSRTFIPKGDGFDPGYGAYAVDILRRFTGALERIEGDNGSIHETLRKAAEHGPAEVPEGYREYLGKSIAYDTIVDAFVKIVHGGEPLSDKNCSGDDFWKRPYLLLDDKCAILIFKDGPNGTRYGSDVIGYRVDLTKPVRGQLAEKNEDTVSVLKRYFIEKEEFAERYRAEERFYLSQRAAYGHGDALDFRNRAHDAFIGVEDRVKRCADEIKRIFKLLREYSLHSTRYDKIRFLPRFRSRYQKVMIRDEYEVWKRLFNEAVNETEALAARDEVVSIPADDHFGGLIKVGLASLRRMLRSITTFGNGEKPGEYADASSMDQVLLDTLGLNKEWFNFCRGKGLLVTTQAGDFIRDRVKNDIQNLDGMFTAEVPVDHAFFDLVPRGEWKWLAFSVDNAISGAVKATREAAFLNGEKDIEGPKIVFSDDGDYLVVKVIDHGTGISKRDLKKVSDADFTKRKETGQACMHRVVTDNGGSAVIDSLTEEERTPEELARRKALGQRTERGVTLTIRWPVKRIGDDTAVEKPKGKKREDVRKHRVPRRNARAIPLALYGVVAVLAGIGFYIFSPGIVDNDAAALIISAGISAAIMAAGFITERMPVVKTRTWTKKKPVWGLSSLGKAADRVKAWRERKAREAEEKIKKEERDEKRPIEKEKKKGRKQAEGERRKAREAIEREVKAVQDAQKERLRDAADKLAAAKKDAAAREHQRLLRRIEEEKAERQRLGRVAAAKGEAKKLRALLRKADDLVQRAYRAASGKLSGARSEVDAAAARLHSAGRAMIDGKRSILAGLERRLEAAGARYKEIDARYREIMAGCEELEKGISECDDEDNATAVLQKFERLLDKYSGEEVPEEAVKYIEDLNARIVFLIEALRLKPLFPASIRPLYVDICRRLYKKDPSGGDRRAIYDKYRAMSIEGRLLRERAARSLREFDASLSAAFRKFKEMLSAQDMARYIEDPDKPEAKPLQFIGLIWKFAVPALRAIGVPERAIAFLGGLEELVFSFAMMKGIVYLCDLAPPGFKVPFSLGITVYLTLAIVSSAVSYAFHAASGELYFFEKERIVSRKIDWKGNKDKKLLLGIGVFGFIIRAVYAGLAAWLDPWSGFSESYTYIVPVLAAVSMHGSFDSVLAYSGKVPLLMIGAFGGTKEKRTGSKSLSKRKVMARVIFMADRDREPTRGEMRRMLDREEAKIMNEGRKFPGKMMLAQAAGVTYGRVLQAANSLDPIRGMRGVGESFGYTMRTRGPERSLRKRENVISTIYERLNGHWPTDEEKKKFVKKNKFDTSDLTPGKLGRDVFENIDKYHGPRARFFRSINYDYRTLDLREWGDFLQELYKDLNGRYPNKKQLSDFRKWKYRGKYLRVSDVSSKTLHWSKHFGNLSGVAERLGFWLGRYDGKWSLGVWDNYCRFLYIEMFHKLPTKKELKKFMDPRNEKEMYFPVIKNYINAFKDATAEHGGVPAVSRRLGFLVDDDLSDRENFLKALFIDLNLRPPREEELKEFGKWKRRNKFLRVKDLSGRVVRAAAEHWGGIAGVSDAQ